MVCIAVTKTLLPSDGKNLLTKMIETQIGDDPITNSVVKGIRSACRDYIERRVLKAFLCSYFPLEKVARLLDSATPDDDDSQHEESDGTVP